MAGGAITRWIRLVLDRNSAKQAEADIKKTTGEVEKQFDKLKGKAKELAGWLAAAFGVRAMLRFGDAAVEAAEGAEKAWGDLAGTIDAAGESFVDLEAGIRAAAAAFQDSTTHSGAAYAEGLKTLISLTGDVRASMNNMGFAANVAAQFFGGDLDAAVAAVAKGMNTGEIIINRMRFSLEEVAKISFGAAAREANTFAGQVKQLGNAWDNFKEELGLALIDAARGTGLIDTLKESVQKLTRWVIDNADQIKDWATSGLDAAAKSVGGLAIAVGVLSSGFGVLTGATLLALQVLNGFQRMISDAFGKEDPWGDWLEATKKKVDDLVVSSAHLTQAGWDLLSNGIIGGGPSGAGHGPPARVPKPRLSKKGLEATGTGGGGSGILHADPSANWWTDSAVRNAVEGVRAAAAKQGILAFTAAMEARMQAGAGGDLGPIGEVVAALDRELKSIGTQADVFGVSFDEAGARASAFETAIRSLADLGLPAGDQAIESLRLSLEAANEAMAKGEVLAMDYGLAVSNLSSLIAGAVGGDLKEVAKAKAKENTLMAAEELAHGLVSLLSPFTAPKAAGHFTAAAKFGAIAAAWGAFGGAIGGGGGGGGTAAASGASGKASQAAKLPDSEIHIHLIGPGFDAMNPEVQRVVYGAQQQARERYGPNAKINITRGR